MEYSRKFSINSPSFGNIIYYPILNYREFENSTTTPFLRLTCNSGSGNAACFP